MVLGGIFKIPTCLQFYERQFVGSITIDLVGAHEDKYALFLVAAKRFEQIERADRVDVEIFKGHLRGQVVRRLRSTMDDEIESFRGKKIQHSRAVADIEFLMAEALKLFFQ